MSTTTYAARSRNSNNTAEYWLAARLRQRAIRQSWLPVNERVRRAGAYRARCEIPRCQVPQLPGEQDSFEQ